MALATKRKPTTHQRKRQAHHHRRSKHYAKAYWPYLPMLMVLGFGIFINSLWSQPQVLGTQQDFSSQSLLTASNQQRVAGQAAALTINPQLTTAAQLKANDMAQQNYWDHTAPDGQTAWMLIAAQGYQYQQAGENLAYGFADAEQVITGWMNSPEHRANLLHADYQEVGFGVAQARNYQGRGPQTIVVAEYGQPASDPALAATPSTTAIPIDSQPISRVQLLTGGQAHWSALAVVLLASGAFIILLVRHSWSWHRVFARSEAFVIKHPHLDILIVVVVTGSLVLTRVSGMVG